VLNNPLSYNLVVFFCAEDEMAGNVLKGFDEPRLFISYTNLMADTVMNGRNYGS
jgi:hypothetical protein